MALATARIAAPFDREAARDRRSLVARRLDRHQAAAGQLTQIEKHSVRSSKDEVLRRQAHMPNALLDTRTGGSLFAARCRTSADRGRRVPALEAIAPEVARSLEARRHRCKCEIARIERFVHFIPGKRGGYRGTRLRAHRVSGRDALSARVLQAIHVYGAAGPVVESALDCSLTCVLLDHA